MAEVTNMGTETKSTTKESTSKINTTRPPRENTTVEPMHCGDGGGVRYLVDADGTRQEVVIPIGVYKQLLEELEELDEVRAYDEAKREGGDPISLADMKADIGL